MSSFLTIIHCCDRCGLTESYTERVPLYAEFEIDDTLPTDSHIRFNRTDFDGLICNICFLKEKGIPNEPRP